MHTPNRIKPGKLKVLPDIPAQPAHEGIMGLDRQYKALLETIPDLDLYDSGLADRMDDWILACLTMPATFEKPSLSFLFDRVSRFNTLVTARIIRDSMADIEAGTGNGPPLPFCWISMGSDARGEQVIRTDQDNALIYADPPEDMLNPAADYFAQLGRTVTAGLDRFGFALCKGNIMASNPQWCHSLGRWLTALDSWVGSADPDAVRKLTIFLDFKPVFGDARLGATLQERVFKNFEAHTAASHFLVRDDQLFAPPKTRFNRIRTIKKKGCSRCFNLKTQGLAHLVNGARIFAVNHGIRTPATLHRLERLGRDQVLSEQACQDLMDTFIFLTRLKLKTHLTGSTGHLEPNCIDLDALEPEQIKALNRHLDVVARFQKKMAKTFNQAWMNFF